MRNPEGTMEPPLSGSDRVVEELESEPELDEVTRARMEKNLLAAVSAGKHLEIDEVELQDLPEDDEAMPAAEVTPIRRYGVIGIGTILAAAAAAALVWSLGAPEAGPNSDGAEVATFSRYEDGQTTARGDFDPRQVLETGEGERVEVRMADARVDVTPHSEVRFVELDEHRVEVLLARGAVEVELHPERTGDQTVRVTTERAHVDVVGTVFRVSVNAASDTLVSTVEGIVRVTPRDGGEALLVHAGEETTIASEAVAVLDEAELADPIEEVLEVLDVDEPEAIEAPDVAPTVSVRTLFTRAEARLDAGDHVAGRHILDGIASTSNRPQHRVRAFTLLAESYASQREYASAAEAYADAVDAGGHSIGAQNALFAMGRLFERQMSDADAATAAYRQYLDLAPGGAHADQIHRALCSMGHAEHCQ